MDNLHYQVDLLSAMNEKLRSTGEMYRLICDTSSDAFLFCQLKEHTFEMAGRFLEFFPFAVRQESDLNQIIEEVALDKRAELRELLDRSDGSREGEILECPSINGKRWYEFTQAFSKNEMGEITAKVIRIKDITRYRKQHEDLKYMAYYDLLTGLYNRNYFIRILRDWVFRAKEKLHVISIMCININDFKHYNDGFGILVGDEILQEFGLLLKKYQKDNVIVSHSASDFFYIAIYDPYGTDSADYIYEDIKKNLKNPLITTTSSVKAQITISAGVTQFPQSGSDVLELLNDAEVIMLHAREKGKNTIGYYETPILDDFLEQFTMEDKLRKAIDKNEFFLCFQPQYDANTKILRGVEALIRWRTEEGMTINPGMFIPVAEQNGMILEIGDWVLDEAFRIFSSWKQRFDTPLILSVNISALQYRQKNFIPKLLRLIEKHHVPATDIELEITESIMIDDFQDVLNKMKILKEYGIKISLDDFGTGYSSLSYLKGLPIDTLKIDKTFIDTVLVDKSSRIIIESIITMVKQLGFETVAEGVETLEQYEYLKDVSCDNIQGYLLGKPMTVEGMEEILTKQEIRIKEERRKNIMTGENDPK
ncbi:MAG: GGDEF domain-containing protein [Lachnospiraceae bacterium]|jgi:diguanylate cyclase (GGDEF)-like protein|nr:GGDEF domain-containing protein [Lachnospiraceae bacterium]